MTEFNELFIYKYIYVVNSYTIFAGIGDFLWDFRTHTLTKDVIRQLDENIPILIGEYFPSVIFNIMEDLVVHLSHEALLREPIHYGLMFPYERSMKHLKGKQKILQRWKVQKFLGV